MKIGILVGHPTQFEGPFYRYAAQDKSHELRVLYMDSAHMAQQFDAEVGRTISWGIDLLQGYYYAVLPGDRPLQWLREDIRTQKYDLLIVSGYTRRACVVAMLAAQFTNTPVAMRLDSVMFDKPPFVKRLLKRAMFKLLDKLSNNFFAVGSLTVEYLEFFGVPQSRVSIFSYAVDVDYFRQGSRLSPGKRRELREKHNIPETNKVLLSATKFNDREAPWDLLKAFCKMDGKNLTLLLVGDGEQRRLLATYAAGYPNHHVVFAGYVPYPELPAFYGIAGVFIHPARNEPWGVSVAEALACGLPVVVSSRVGAGYDLIRPANGAVYEAGNADDLAIKLTSTFGLDLAMVRCESDKILKRWDYAATWQNILGVALKGANRRAKRHSQEVESSTV